MESLWYGTGRGICLCPDSFGRNFFCPFDDLYVFFLLFASKEQPPRFAQYGVLCLAIGIGISLYAFGIQRLAKHQTEIH